MREYHIPSSHTLFDFRRFIDNDLDFDDSQQVMFFLLNNEKVKVECYSLFDMGNGTMDSVTLEDLAKKGMAKLLYTFDCFNKRSLLIEFKGKIEELPRTSYPMVTLSKGEPPGQFTENPQEDEFPEVPEDEEEDSDEYFDEEDNI